MAKKRFSIWADDNEEENTNNKKETKDTSAVKEETKNTTRFSVLDDEQLDLETSAIEETSSIAKEKETEELYFFAGLGGTSIPKREEEEKENTSVLSEEKEKDTEELYFFGGLGGTTIPKREGDDEEINFTAFDKEEETEHKELPYFWGGLGNTPLPKIEGNEEVLDFSKLLKEEEEEEIPRHRRVFYWNIDLDPLFLHRTYGVHLQYSPHKNIQYLLEVKCEGFKKGVFLYTLIRKRVFKEGKELETVMEQLAEQSVQCLYPLQVHVNSYGQIMAVANAETIQKRWEKLRPELTKRYSGAPFLRYCQKIDLAVSTPKRLLQSLDNDVVYDILFSKMYISHTSAYTRTLEKEFKWFSGIEKLRFTGKQTLYKVRKKNRRLQIEYEGTLQPVAGLENGKTKILYELEGRDHNILRIDGTFDYTQENQDKTIQFSAIWQKNLDKTKERQIEDEKRKGLYIDPNKPKKWWEFWKLYLL
jgi:hypothetical protein